MAKRILLVEPKTRTSYPPMGLMKLATYHELQGDYVEFVLGMNKKQRDDFWDTIYITSTFTYDFDILVRTIKFYRGNPANSPVVKVGGIAASLLAPQIERETGISPHFGLLAQPDASLAQCAAKMPALAYLAACAPTIDNLPPHYGMFGESSSRYAKILDNSYFLFATKGCLTGCDFCAVVKLEPKFIDYIPILPRVKYISERWGERDNLLLLDNNVAASTQYSRIIDEIKDCGFKKGEKLIKTNAQGKKIFKNRSVDFNQGVDIRRMNKKKMIKMAEIAIKPLRLAFDNISLAHVYDEQARLALDCGITHLSNYMLFNFSDAPVELYQRLMINIRLLKDYPNAKIYSFPMRYSPVDRVDRAFLGDKWTKRELRNLQLIIHATHGIVSNNRDFFKRAFGDSEEQYKRLLLYPYNYIINRNHYEYKTKDIARWEHAYSGLTNNERDEFKSIISRGVMKQLPLTINYKINKLLEHYIGEHSYIIPKNT